MTKEELKQEAEERADEYTNLRPFHIGYEEGYFDGADTREKRIAELEEQNTSLLTSVENLNKSVQELEQKLEQTENDLEDYQFNYPTIKELQKENDYQKQARSIAENAVVNLTKENAELKSENQKWKDEWQEQVQKVTDEGYARTLQTMQLTKAKEIIKNLMIFAEMDDREYEKEYKEAEQFLSEVEI